MLVRYTFSKRSTFLNCEIPLSLFKYQVVPHPQVGWGPFGIHGLLEFMSQ